MALILGSKGMLGSMVKQVMPDATTRDRPDFDAEDYLNKPFMPGQRVINCIGIIKPYCGDVPRAIKVNALFPYSLPAGSIQIATDCVYFGSKGNYLESDPHDAIDVYGQTKSLGEAPHLNNLRCSIIGPEVQNHVSLLEWFLRQQKTVNGFTNHFWNGLTTYHFALIVKAAIEAKIELPKIQHLVPADKVSKAELLQIISQEFKHRVVIKPVAAPVAVDRTLATSYPYLNKKLWQLAGYDEPPTIRQMIKELANL